jgi:hypothetical protein
MKRPAIFMLTIALLITSCATIGEKRRLEKFEETEKGYRQALMGSDFALAARYLDPAVSREPVPPEQYALVRIVDYKPTRVDVSGDLLKIEQGVVLKYFMVNVNLLRTVQYQQVWHFNEAHKIWLLQTDLPALNP